ncbi:MAG: transposase, partial [Syntrophomonadaceae bacterium]|nr:transposase [Syntrophomonadaceae bacterium]
KYSRRGHLFQDRYKSEAVETDTYFLTVLRYIHQNPVKAGITEKIQTYPWSSYREYTEKPVICATQFAMELFSEDKAVSLHLMEEFHQEPNKDQCLEPDHGVRINDLEAAELIQKIAEVKSPQEIQAFEKQKRNAVIRELKKRQLSIRQIERLTGISFGIIRNL